MPSHFLISWLISWFPGWFVPGKTTQKPPHRPPHKPPDEEAPSMWLLGFSVSQSAGSREAPEGSWNDPRVEAPPSTPGGAVFVFKKNTAKTTQSGKIYITGGFWFPKKKHSIDQLLVRNFSWPFLTNQISRFQLFGSLSNIKCLLAEIEVDSTFPFLLLNQLNCCKKTSIHGNEVSNTSTYFSKKRSSVCQGVHNIWWVKGILRWEFLSCAVSPLVRLKLAVAFVSQKLGALKSSTILWKPKISTGHVGT